jgi:hypothetical protein
MTETKMWAVYRKLHNGSLLYVPRSCTTSQKLAEEIAADLSNGRIVMPDGSTRKVMPHPHIAKEM